MSLFDKDQFTAAQKLHIIGREELIYILQQEDPNGVYNDKDSTNEFGAPATLEELKESFWRLYDGANGTNSSTNITDMNKREVPF